MSGAGNDLARVVGFPSEDEAREAATTLLEHGIGPEIVREEGLGSNLLTGSGAVHALHVLAPDLDRAREVLGLVPAGHDAGPGDEGVEPASPWDPGAAAPGDTSVGVGPEWAGGAAADGEEVEKAEVVHSFFGGRLQLTTRQVWRIALLYLAAFILIPALFYFGTQWVVEPEVESPDVTVQRSPVFTID